MELFEILQTGNTMERILQGLGVTLEIALITTFLSIILGFGLGTLMTSRNRAIRLICKLYLEFFRLMPQLVLLFVFYYGLTTAIGLNLDALTSSVVVFTLWGTAEMGDLVRSSILNVPRGQIESAKAIGLSRLKVNLQVKYPLAIRQIIPGCVNLVTRIIKTTAIVPLIGVVDVTKAANAIIDFNRFNYPGSALYIYALVFMLYFICCFPLDRLAKFAGRRLAS